MTLEIPSLDDDSVGVHQDAGAEASGGGGGGGVGDAHHPGPVSRCRLPSSQHAGQYSRQAATS